MKRINILTAVWLKKSCSLTEVMVKILYSDAVLFEGP